MGSKHADPPRSVQDGDPAAYLAWLRGDQRDAAPSPETLPPRPLAEVIAILTRRLDPS